MSGFPPLVCHLRAEPFKKCLVDIILNADSREDLAHVGEQPPVQAPDPLRPPDVAEQADGVGLLPGQQQLGAESRLALQLGPDQGEGVGRQLAAARTNNNAANYGVAGVLKRSGVPRFSVDGGSFWFAMIIGAQG